MTPSLPQHHLTGHLTGHLHPQRDHDFSTPRSPAGIQWSVAL